MTGILIEGKAVGSGTFALIFVDEISAIGSMTAIEGCDIDDIIPGSMAYDANGKVAIYDGSSWSTVGE